MSASRSSIPCMNQPLRGSGATAREGCLRALSRTTPRSRFVLLISTRTLPRLNNLLLQNILVQDVESFECTQALMIKTYPNGASASRPDFPLVPRTELTLLSSPGYVRNVMFRNFTGISNTYNAYSPLGDLFVRASWLTAFPFSHGVLGG